MDGVTRVVERRHEGPLRVQKSLYPEGPEVCHHIIVHPPAGLVGGDRVAISLDLEKNARVFVSTPGAQKWYRSPGPWASQTVTLQLGEKASLEWFPQEAILYNQSLGSSLTEVVLARDAVFMGWDIVCLGRVESGEHFLEGSYCPQTRVIRDNTLIWFEKGRMHGGTHWFKSPVGLNGMAVMGTFIASGSGLSDTMGKDVQERFGERLNMCVTRVPGVLVARYLGHDAWEAKRLFSEVWRMIRPVMLDRPAISPRIWAT
jgi:urease accessory protein